MLFFNNKLYLYLQKAYIFIKKTKIYIIYINLQSYKSFAEINNKNKSHKFFANINNKDIENSFVNNLIIIFKIIKDFDIFIIIFNVDAFKKLTQIITFENKFTFALVFVYHEKRN